MFSHPLPHETPTVPCVCVHLPRLRPNSAEQAREFAAAAFVAADAADRAFREAEALPPVTHVESQWVPVTDSESGNTYYEDKVCGGREWR